MRDSTTARLPGDPTHHAQHSPWSKGTSQALGSTYGSGPPRREAGVDGQTSPRRPWQIRLYSGFGLPKHANQRFKYLLGRGNDGLSCAFDLPTQVGLDSDHPLAGGEVGRLGVAVDSLEDFRSLFEGINLGSVPISLNTSDNTIVLACLLLQTCHKQLRQVTSLRGTLSNDPIIELVARMGLIFPLRSSLRLCAATAAFFLQHTKIFPVAIRGYVLREAGATRVQEIAWALSIACAYIDEIIKLGAPPSEVLSRTCFFFGHDLEIFHEAARYRAAQKSWSDLLWQRYGVKKGDEAARLRFTSSTLGSCFTLEDPLTNLIRGGIGALSGALGGTNGMIQPAYDEAYQLPTEHSHHLALRVQQIAANETDVLAAVDPLAGSHFVESLTREFSLEIDAELETISKKGGIVKLASSGELDGQLSANMNERYQTNSNKNSSPATDSPSECNCESCRREPGATPDAWFAEILREQQRSLRERKRCRSNRAVIRALRGLRETVKGDRTPLPRIMEAVLAEATVGEVFSAMKESLGEWSPAARRSDE